MNAHNTHDDERLEATHKAALASIVELVQDLQDAEESGDDDAMDQAREAIETDALSVLVRGGWHTPGGTHSEIAEAEQPEEFEILITTGGPAVRIRGTLNQWCEPEHARLEVQDWFKPWTSFFTSTEEDAAIMLYCQQFYFGG